jgi:E3 ubiquitin-protein ligase SDIR1
MIIVYLDSALQKKQDGLKADGTSKTPEDELTCSVCLEQVAVGDLLRSLPCLHQVIMLIILPLVFLVWKQQMISVLFPF